jgi:nitronate monooxygenase
VIIAQGNEAGGHVPGEVSTMVLLPRIVDAVAPTLVLAAGGIADARGLAAALCLGADGVVTAAEILRETINGAERLIRELSAKVHENGRT